MDPTAVLAVLLALAPAAVSWWTGRQLLRQADDPALPELLLVRQQRIVGVVGVAVGVLYVVCTRHAAWATLLLVVALLVAAYPMRRSLFGESWGLGAYLWYSARSVVGGFGFWLTLAYAPWIVLKLPLAYRVPGAAAVGVVLALWQFWYQWVWLRARGATPLEREDLRARFDEVVQRSGVHPPRLFRFGTKFDW